MLWLNSPSSPERSILLCSDHSVTFNQDGSGLFLTQAVKPRRSSKKKDKRLIEKKNEVKEKLLPKNEFDFALIFQLFPLLLPLLHNHLPQ